MLLAHRPAPPLSLSVEKLWYCEDYRVAHRQERVLPIPRFQLIIDLTGPPPFVLGMRSNCSVIDTTLLRSMMGVVFWPGTARRFIHAPADAFHNAAVLLEDVWGRRIADLRDRLREAPTPAEKFAVLEQGLLRMADERIDLHPSIRYGLGEFQKRPHIQRVLDVTKAAGLSRRRFAQLFREHVGLTPKLYCRLLRFRQVVDHVHRGGLVDWADVAAAGGYCDQAHLIHEFREFSGISPGAYLSSERVSPSHVAIE
jgi:AraC-like DNA-binding protein